MARTTQVTVWVLVGENGDYVVSADDADIGELFTDNVSDDPSYARRMVKVVLTVPLPEPVTMNGTVPAEGEVELNVG